MKKLFIPFLILIWINGYSQVGIGTSAPHSSAALEINSTNSGLLLPRPSSEQRSLIDSPAAGLLIFNSSLNCLELNKGTPIIPDWYCLATSDISSTSNGTAVVSSYQNSTAYGAIYVGQSSSEAKQFISAIVVTPGTYSLSATANGITFSGFGTFVSTGPQLVVLSAIGTPNFSGVFNFPLNVSTGSSFDREVKVLPPLGSTYSLSNGTELFSSQAACTSKVISATHTPLTCTGSVITQRDTYNVVLINGQCWMKQNLNEIPIWPCGSNINTGCNTWINTSLGADSGYWGYFNTSTTNGSAGWSTSEAISNEGLLYQYSAAMNGSTAERSQGVCPQGWHIPSDCEWKYLEHGLGLTISQQNALSRSSSVFSSLRDSSFGGNNTSGFSLLLVGLRTASSGAFLNRNSQVILWTSSVFNASYKTVKTFTSTNTSLNRGELYGACSVRCIKD